MTPSNLRAWFIKEPGLTFGDGRSYIDPKKGLLAYGPCLYEDRRAITSSIRIGIIGSKETVDLAQQWIERLQYDIPGKEEDSLLFQSFPSFTKIFGCKLLVLKNCMETLKEDDIKKVLMIRDFKHGVESAAKLFIEGLSSIRDGREPRPHVVICALPQGIVDRFAVRKRGAFGAPSSVTKEEREIITRLKKLQRKGQTTLFPVEEQDGYLETSPETSNLRRMIKAAAMHLDMPTQLVWPESLTVDPKNTKVQDLATRAWNFSVALYYKAEGYPWKLAKMQQGTCYVGISFYRDPRSEGRGLNSSIAQIFTHTGEGLVLKGGRAMIDEATGSAHLSKPSAKKLMTDILEKYEKQMHQMPTRLVVHKSSRYNSDELQGFKAASQAIQLKDFLAIEVRGIRFMRKKGIYPPIRGTVVQIGTRDFIVFTKGWIPYLGTYPGLRVPMPLEVVEHYGDASIETLCEEILALTKMNWNSADFCIREPVTLAYAREFGKILAYVPTKDRVRPEYFFYM